MAQPPDINETFLREVDEDLRRDRARDFARKYGTWLIAAVILLLAAAGGWIYWNHHQLKKSEARVEQLAQVYRDIAGGNMQGAAKELDTLSAESSDAVRASALLTRAAIAIEQKDMPLAIRLFGEVAGDESLPDAYRNLALVRQTTLEFDKLKPEEVIARLAPLTQAGNPWYGSAGELTGAALLKQGKRQQAGQMFVALAKDKSVPESIRDRSVQLASTLGVDVSGVIDAPAQ